MKKAPAGLYNCSRQHGQHANKSIPPIEHYAVFYQTLKYQSLTQFSPELCVKKKTPGQFATSHPTPHRDKCGVKSGVTVATAYFKMDYMLCSN